MKNLSGYCDYNACRKFNHRYISSRKKEVITDIYVTHDFAEPYWLRPSSISGNVFTSSGYINGRNVDVFPPVPSGPTNFNISSSFYTHDISEAVEFFNDKLQKINGRRVYLSFGVNSFFEPLSVGFNPITYNNILLTINEQQITGLQQDQYLPEVIVLSEIIDVDITNLVNLKSEITAGDITQPSDGLYYANLTATTFHLPITSRVEFTFTGANEPDLIGHFTCTNLPGDVMATIEHGAHTNKYYDDSILKFK